MERELKDLFLQSIKEVLLKGTPNISKAIVITYKNSFDEFVNYNFSIKDLSFYSTYPNKLRVYNNNDFLGEFEIDESYIWLIKLIEYLKHKNLLKDFNKYINS